MTPSLVLYCKKGHKKIATVYISIFSLPKPIQVLLVMDFSTVTPKMLQSTESDSWLASNDPIIIDSTMHDDLFCMHIETNTIDLMMDYLAPSIFVTWINCTLFYHNAGLLNTI